MRVLLTKNPAPSRSRVHTVETTPMIDLIKQILQKIIQLFFSLFNPYSLFGDICNCHNGDSFFHVIKY